MSNIGVKDAISGKCGVKDAVIILAKYIKKAGDKYGESPIRTEAIKKLKEYLQSDNEKVRAEAESSFNALGEKYTIPVSAAIRPLIQAEEAAQRAAEEKSEHAIKMVNLLGEISKLVQNNMMEESLLIDVTDLMQKKEELIGKQEEAKNRSVDAIVAVVTQAREIINEAIIALQGAKKIINEAITVKKGEMIIDASYTSLFTAIDTLINAVNHRDAQEIVDEIVNAINAIKQLNEEEGEGDEEEQDNEEEGDEEEQDNEEEGDEEEGDEEEGDEEEQDNEEEGDEEEQDNEEEGDEEEGDEEEQDNEEEGDEEEGDEEEQDNEEEGDEEEQDNEQGQEEYNICGQKGTFTKTLAINHKHENLFSSQPVNVSLYSLLNEKMKNNVFIDLNHDDVVSFIYQTYEYDKDGKCYTIHNNVYYAFPEDNETSVTLTANTEKIFQLLEVAQEKEVAHKIDNGKCKVTLLKATETTKTTIVIEDSDNNDKYNLHFVDYIFTADDEDIICDTTDLL